MTSNTMFSADEFSDDLLERFVVHRLWHFDRVLLSSAGIHRAYAGLSDFKRKAALSSSHSDRRL